VIRPAGEDDVDAILAITNDAILNSTAMYTYEPMTRAEQAAWLADKRAGGWPVLVADDGAGCLGFATFGPFRTRPAYARTVEHSVYVAGHAHGRGVGRLLMTALIEEARRRGLHAMIGGVDSENAGSLAFHAGLGFVEVGRMREVGWKFGRWLDLVFVEKLLEDQ
jgi:phosphinothricin acetyltransferase